MEKFLKLLYSLLPLQLYYLFRANIMFEQKSSICTPSSFNGYVYFSKYIYLLMFALSRVQQFSGLYLLIYFSHNKLPTFEWRTFCRHMTAGHRLGDLCNNNFCGNCSCGDSRHREEVLYLGKGRTTTKRAYIIIQQQ